MTNDDYTHLSLAVHHITAFELKNLTVQLRTTAGTIIKAAFSYMVRLGCNLLPFTDWEQKNKF